MKSTELIEKWIYVFGEGVDKTIMEKHVTSYGNHLWHLFTWGRVSCLKGDAAREAFNKLEYTKAVKFLGGYSNGIENVITIDRVSADKLDNDPESDVYIVAQDFSWTYVRTHEDACGPYFCVKK